MQADARRRGGEDRPLLGVPIAIKDDTDIQGEVTAWGTGAIETPAARGLRGRAPAAHRRRRVPRQDQRPRADDHAVHGVADVGHHAQPVGPPAQRRRVERRLCGGRRGRAWPRRRLGSDGGGSIRIPAAACGLFGLKPERGRVPTAPMAEPWHGLSIWGAISRRVIDSARFYDAIRDGGESFAEAASREPGRLRIAVSRKPPAQVPARPDAEQLGGAARARPTLLRSLGHDVVDRELDWGTAWLQLRPALPARHPRRGRDRRAPRAPGAAHPRLHAARRR